MTIVTGGVLALINAVEGDTTPVGFASYFLIPLAANSIAQIRIEQLHRHELQMLGNLALNQPQEEPPGNNE